MAKLTRSITIDAPVDKVFDYALDIRKLWKFKDLALTEVEITPNGVGTSARMYTHFLAFHMEGGVEGEFNWSSQHLDLEVFDGKTAAGCRSCAASEDAVAGQVGFPAAG